MRGAKGRFFFCVCVLVFVRLFVVACVLCAQSTLQIVQIDEALKVQSWFQDGKNPLLLTVTTTGQLYVPATIRWTGVIVAVAVMVGVHWNTTKIVGPWRIWLMVTGWVIATRKLAIAGPAALSNLAASIDGQVQWGGGGAHEQVRARTIVAVIILWAAYTSTATTATKELLHLINSWGRHGFRAKFEVQSCCVTVT